MSNVLKSVSVFYLTKPSDDPVSEHDGMFNWIFSIVDKSGKCLREFFFF